MKSRDVNNGTVHSARSHTTRGRLRDSSPVSSSSHCSRSRISSSGRDAIRRCDDVSYRPLAQGTSGGVPKPVQDALTVEQVAAGLGQEDNVAAVVEVEEADGAFDEFVGFGGRGGGGGRVSGVGRGGISSTRNSTNSTSSTSSI